MHALLGTGSEDRRSVVGCRIHRLGRDPHERDPAAQLPMGLRPKPPALTPTSSASCHRTRSTTAEASNEPGCSHTRSLRSPRSPISSTRSSVHTRSTAPSPAMNASAAIRMPNATWSASSSGGSNATSRCSSGGGVRGSTGRESLPDAKSCRRMPRSPKRSRTRSGCHRGELSERLDPEPGEQPHEVRRGDTGSKRRAGAERRRLEHRDGQGREEAGRSAGRARRRRDRPRWWPPSPPARR